jgi:hypothetical protein
MTRSGSPFGSVPRGAPWPPGRSTVPSSGVTAGEVAPDEVLAEMDSVARKKAKTRRAIARQRGRRRLLPAVMVGSALVVTAGLADRFVQSTLPSVQATVAPAPTSGATSGALTATPTAAQLAQVARALAADEQAIAAIAQAQAGLSQAAGDDGGSGGRLPAIVLPKLPNLPNVPNASVPTVPAAPAAHATTGASVVVP